MRERDREQDVDATSSDMLLHMMDDAAIEPQKPVSLVLGLYYSVDRLSIV